MRSRAESGAALALQLAGSAFELLISARHWQTVHVLRTRPLADQTFALTGRTLDAAPTALAVVALAGVVAVLAVRGWPRRIVGAVVAAVGIGVVWRSLQHVSAVSLGRAFDLHGAGGNVTAGAALAGSHVTAQPVWPWLSALCGLLIFAAGAVTAVHGGRWAALSSRYESPTAPVTSPSDAQAERARADASLWKALDEGDDPTAHS
jgi:uncharacterized membrane protein (TIGR02234 family)